MKSGSTDLSIQNVTGYKMVGKAVDSDSISRADAETDNPDKGTLDDQFDVPIDGVGYYLAPLVANGTKCKYVIDPATSSSYKFQEYSGSSRAYLSSFTIAGSATFEIRSYNFESVSGETKTVSRALAISLSDIVSDDDSLTFSLSNNQITASNNGASTYKVWLDYVNLSLGFEIIDGLSNYQIAETANGRMSRGVAPKRLATTTTQAQDATRIYSEDQRGYSFCTIHLWVDAKGYETDSASGHSYGKDDLIYYLQETYGSEFTGTWSYQHKSGTRWKQNDSSSAYGDFLIANVIGSLNSDSNKPQVEVVLPWWVCKFKFQYTNGNDGWLPADGYEVNPSNGWKKYVNGYYFQNNSGNGQYDIVIGDGYTNTFPAFKITTKARSSNGNDLSTIATDEARSIFDYYLPGQPSVSNYSFAGWYSDSSFGNSYSACRPTANTTLFAKMLGQVITLDFDGGTGGSSSAYGDNGYALPSITIPTKDGYDFGGYFTQKQGKGTQYYTSLGTSSRSWNLTSDTTLYAKWTPIEYDVCFFANDGGGSMDNQTFTYDVAQTLSVNTFSAPTGKAFAGWATSEARANEETVDYTDGQSVMNLRKTAGNFDLYAVWVTWTFTLAYDGNGNTNDWVPGESFVGTKTVGEITIASNGYTRNGYNFAGWDIVVDSIDKGDVAANASTHPFTTAEVVANGKTVTLRAKWTPKTYDIIYLTDGGEALSNGQYTVSSSSQTVTLDDTTKSGYTFAAYTISVDTSGGSSEISNGTTLSIPANAYGDITVLASWNAVNYTITYDTSGGNTIAPTSYTVAGASIALTEPTRGGYTFAGYSVSSPATGTASISNLTLTIAEGTTGNLTVTAAWTGKAYDITYDTAGGEEISKTTYQVSGSQRVVSLMSPTRSGGYVFAGYSSSGASSSASNLTLTIPANGYGNITVTASWTRKAGAYIVGLNGNWDVDDAHGLYQDDPIADESFQATWTNVVLAQGTTLKIVHYTGSTIDVWYSNGFGTYSDNAVTWATPYNSKDNNITIGSTGTYRIRLEKSTNKITFGRQFTVTGHMSGYGASEDLVEAAFSDTLYAAPARPEKTGYHESGWKYSNGDSYSAIAPNQDLHIYLAYEINVYTVSWYKYYLSYATDGTSTPVNTLIETRDNIEHGSVPEFPTPATMTGYTYSGEWKIGSGDGETADTSGQIVGDAEFFAIFNVISYSITWNHDDKSQIDTTPVNYGVLPAHAADTKSEDTYYVYSFAGWTPEIVPASANATYTAVFNKTGRTYSVTLILNGGQVASGNITSYQYEEGATLPEDVTRADYTFKGWFDNSELTGEAILAIPSDATGNKTFYAKWETYTGFAGGDKVYFAPDAANWTADGACFAIHVWNANENATVKMEAFTDEIMNRTYYQATVPSGNDNWKNILFARVRSDWQVSDGLSGEKFWNQTGDLKVISPKFLYQLTGGETASPTGRWCVRLDPTKTSTYYYFDNRLNEQGNHVWAAPYAYSWNDAHKTDNYYYPDFKLSNWPGKAMTKESSTISVGGVQVDATHVWSITTYTAFDRIIFNKGEGASGSNAGDQTVDLTCTNKNGYFFVLTGEVIDSGEDAGKWGGEWHNAIYPVNYTSVYFDNGTYVAGMSDVQATGYTFGTEKYQIPNELGLPTVLYKGNDNSGIVYTLSLENPVSYYQTFSNGVLGSPFVSLSNHLTPVNGVVTLYVKYTCNTTGYRTFYCDAVDGTSLAVKDNAGTTTWVTFTTESGNYVAPGLFRISMAPTTQFKLNASDAIEVSDSDDMLLVSSSSYLTLKNINYGTAKIYVNGIEEKNMAVGNGTNNYFIYENGIAVKENDTVRVSVTGEQVQGLAATYDATKYSGTLPWFLRYRIYVTGVPQSWSKIYAYVWKNSGSNEGDVVAPWPGIEVTHENDAYYYDLPSGYSKIIFNDGTTGTNEQTVDLTLTSGHRNFAIGAKSTKYALTSSAPANDQEFEIAVSEDIRLNFYITNAKQLSIAAVPNLGNGFYIMPSDGTSNTGFEKAIKMSTYGDNSGALYNRFYFVEGQSYYIRSYISAYDHLVKNFGTCPSGFTCNSTTGIISVTGSQKTGYYRIEIENDTITISPFEGTDFFKLNVLPLDRGNNIKELNTSLVLQIEFSLTNQHPMVITANAGKSNGAANSMIGFAGAALWVQDEPLKDPYNDLRAESGIYTSLNSMTGAMTDLHSYSVPAGDDTRTLYAYILVDYKPAAVANSGSLVNAAYDFVFTLTATQEDNQNA